MAQATRQTVDAHSMRMTIAVAAICISQASCSVMFVESLQDGWRPAQGEPRCSVQGGFVAWDMLAAIAGAVATGATVYYGSATGLTDRESREFTAYAALSAVGAAGHAASFVVGARRVGECQRARLLLNQRMRAR